MIVCYLQYEVSIDADGLISVEEDSLSVGHNYTSHSLQL